MWHHTGRPTTDHCTETVWGSYRVPIYEPKRYELDQILDVLILHSNSILTCNEITSDCLFINFSVYFMINKVKSFRIFTKMNLLRCLIDRLLYYPLHNDVIDQVGDVKLELRYDPN